MPRDIPSWNPREYLRFERERTLPCRDLVNRIELDSPSTVADLGCGPGNSTAVLAERWPGAKLLGVDNSTAMLEKARNSPTTADWVLADIRDWTPGYACDLLFSNAALQWVPDHDRQVPRLFSLVAEDGALAFQIPSGKGAWVEALREVVGLPAWRATLPESVVDLRTEELSFYYDLLSPLSQRLDLWETEYMHILPGPDSVVEWTSGTALRPLLDRLSEEKRASFFADYTKAINEAYPGRPDGKVLFPFLRRFVVAYR